MSLKTKEMAERSNYLAHVAQEFQGIAAEKGLDHNDFLKVLLAAFCTKAVMCGLNKKAVLRFFHQYWASAEDGREGSE